MSDLPSIDDALASVLARTHPLDAEDVPIGEAAGRVAAADARVAVDLPPFPSSAMDGYAVRAGDTPGALRLAGRAAAGRPYRGALAAGEAVEISTGAVVPEGADAVVPVEQSGREGDRIRLEGVAPGAHVRPRGGDARSGDVVVEAGTRLRAPQVAALAAAGVGRLSCTRRVRVAVVATGTELRPPGTELAPGEIYESNSVLLAAQIASAGALADVLPVVGDDAEATKAALERGLDADVLVTSGGVSVGPHDLVRAALGELGAEEVFWRVAVRPGKPVAFAVCGSTLVFGLPGNPVSSLVGFELFVRPALRALAGERHPAPAYRPGRLARALRRNATRDELVRARTRVDGDAVVLEPVDGQESHMIVRAATADALVLVGRGAGELAAGESVRYLPI